MYAKSRKIYLPRKIPPGMAEPQDNLPPVNHAWTRLLPESARRWLAGRDALHGIIGNIGWQVADNVLRMGVGFLLGIWVARYLGPQQFGLLSYALAFAALFSPLAMLGLDDIVVRNLVRDPAAKQAILGTSFFLRLIGGVLSTLATIAVIAWLRPDDRQSVWLVAIIAAGTLFQAFNTIELWFNAQVQAKYPVLARNASFLVCALGKIVLIIAGAPLVAFASISLRKKEVPRMTCFEAGSRTKLRTTISSRPSMASGEKSATKARA